MARAERVRTEEDRSDTLPRLLVRNYHLYGDSRVALREKDFGIWKSYSWEDYYLKVKYLCLGLIELGLGAGDRVAVIGDNRPQWYWAELATQAAGGINLGVFPDCTAQEIKFYLEHSEAKFVVVKDQEQVDKLLQIKDKLPHLRKIIYWDPKGLRNYQDPLLMDLDALMELGQKVDKASPAVFEERVASTQGQDVAVLLYTSGTGGVPKAAMTTHQNLLQAERLWAQVVPFETSDRYISVLSPCWAPEQSMGVTMNLDWAFVVHFPEGADTTQQDMREVGPMLFMAAPRIWENMSSMIQAKMQDANFFNSWLYSRLLTIGYHRARLAAARRKPSPLWKALYWVADLLLFRPLRDKLGLSHVRNAFTAGGALGEDVFLFFRAMGANIKQLYAITETSQVATHRDDDVRFDTVGPAIPGVEIRISDRGEVLVKSPANSVGYFKNPQAYALAMVDGWFHTGDAGFLDEDSHLVCMDRMADVLRLKDGSKFSPSYIENRLKFSPYVKDAVILGGAERPYVAVLVSIDLENVGRWAEARRIPYTTFTDLSQKAEVYDLVRQDVERANGVLPTAVRIKRFANLHKELDPDEAEMTRTRKLRRSYFEEHYSDLVEALYADKGEVLVQAEVKYRDGRSRLTSTVVKVVSLDGGVA